MQAEEVNLPEKADLIISEPMGTLLLNERMVESFVVARDRFLSEEGRMFPSKSTIYLSPFSDEVLFAEQYSKSLFWAQSEFHGVDLSALREAALRNHFSQPIVDAFDPSILLDRPVKHLIDFATISDAALRKVEIPFRFVARYTANLHGIAGTLPT